jgi:DNA-3-methyladenine glycosylase I
VNAAVENARRIQNLRAEHGSFLSWLEAHHPLSKEGWTRLFKKTFVFTGGEIVGEFLLSTGYLGGAHEESCPVFSTIAAQGPAFLRQAPETSSS